MSGHMPNGASAAACPIGITPEAIHEETKRVLADPLFRYSQRSSNLLRFIVDRTLKGHNGDLKERIIGIEVFGRAPDYDTSNDSTVRVVANEVRKRLNEYYSKAEHAHEVRIDVPVRSYVAEFRLPEASPPEPQPQVEAEPKSRRKLFQRWYVWAPATALVLALAVWAVIQLAFPSPVIDRFWAPVLRTSGPALICVGSPYDPFDSNEVSAGDAPSPNSAAREIPFYYSEQRVYVRMLDANAAADLEEYLRRKGKNSEVRPTQGAQLEDLHSDAIILYGMALNESVVKLGTDLHFVFRKESESGHGLRWIEDTSNPAHRNWSVDLSAPYDQVGNDYALLSRVRDQTTGRWWIGIAGLTGVGTFAASQVVTDPKAMSNIGANLPTGWDRKNLQILLEIKVAQGRPGATRVVTSYSW